MRGGWQKERMLEYHGAQHEGKFREGEVKGEAEQRQKPHDLSETGRRAPQPPNGGG